MKITFSYYQFRFKKKVKIRALGTKIYTIPNFLYNFGTFMVLKIITFEVIKIFFLQGFVECVYQISCLYHNLNDSYLICNYLLHYYAAFFIHCQRRQKISSASAALPQSSHAALRLKNQGDIFFLDYVKIPLFIF